jgi:hypothetical protein
VYQGNRIRSTAKSVSPCRRGVRRYRILGVRLAVSRSQHAINKETGTSAPASRDMLHKMKHTVFISSRSALWLSVATLFTPCLSQTIANESLHNICPSPPIGILSPNAPITSTGMRPFRWTGFTQDWYLTSTFNDTRSSVNVSQRHEFQGYISAPMNADARACVSMFGGINGTVKGDNGCEGLLSQRCLDYLAVNVTFAGFPSRWGGNATSCDVLPVHDRWYEDACGEELKSGIGNSTYTSFHNKYDEYHAEMANQDRSPNCFLKPLLHHPLATSKLHAIGLSHLACCGLQSRSR